MAKNLLDNVTNLGIIAVVGVLGYQGLKFGNKFLDLKEGTSTSGLFNTTPTINGVEFREDDTGFNINDKLLKDKIALFDANLKNKESDLNKIIQEFTKNYLANTPQSPNAGIIYNSPNAPSKQDIDSFCD